MALSKSEEDVLKRLARENTPMQIVNPQPASIDNESASAAGRHVDRLLKRSGGHQIVYGGPDASDKNAGTGVIATIQERGGIEVDRDFIAKVHEFFLEKTEGPSTWGWWNGVKKLFQKKRVEHPMEFIARTGLGPADVKNLSREEIARRIALRAEQDREQGIVEPRASFRPEPEAKRPPVTFIDTGAPGPDEPAEPTPAWT
jgi:hypothetical protein